MPVEIERKYLVKDEFKHLASKSYRIAQGYLSSQNGITVRIRIRDDKGYITVKGKRNASGLSRYEWEKEISLGDAKELLMLCEPVIIDKTRHIVIFEDQEFEVDEFHGDNEGLIVAELELESEDTPIIYPHWLGQEVTPEKKYSNSYLSKFPYKTWK